jgi:hypothetical protein
LKNKEKNLTPPYFVYAPPDFGDVSYHYRAPKPPYAGAESWKCSVYYYWWLYLKRNDDYRLTCEEGGNGACAELYRKFGDIYEGDFKAWWNKHWELFAEPVAVVAHTDQRQGFDSAITLRIDLKAKRNRVLDDIRFILADIQADLDQERVTSDAHYPVETNPMLSSLHQHLVVWDMKKINEWVDDAVLADIADIRVNHVVDGSTAEQARVRLNDREVARITSEVKRRKVQAAQRHLRVAEQYIQNAGLGRFPYRLGR